MAMSSGIYVRTFHQALGNVYALDLDADTIKWQFTGNTITPDYDDATDPIEADLTDEVTGTGYTTGGETLGSPTWTQVTQYIKLDGTDVSLSNTTLSGVYGVFLFDDTIAAPVDPLLCGVLFSGAPYTTSAGTFAITWDDTANAIFRFSAY